VIIARSIPPAPLIKGGADRRGDLTIFDTYLLINLQQIYNDKVPEDLAQGFPRQI